MIVRRFCCFVALLALAGGAAAQAFPSRTVNLVVPNPPGGAIDIQARYLGIYQRLVQPVHKGATLLK